MKETKYTPGPWEVKKSSNQHGASTTYVIYATSPFQILQSENGNRFSIGSVSMRDFYGHVWQFPIDKNGEMINEESFNHSPLPHEANAKLIAAAPELLEALKEIISHKDEIEGLQLWNLTRAIELGEAAIKKATL